MQDVIVGLLAIAVGALFCFRGYLAMRIIIPIWGGFAGFMLGAGLVASFEDAGFLRSAVAWVVGIAVALLFAVCAYLYYEISVAIAMAAIGFTLGTSIMVALGVTWSWVIILVGVFLAIVLAIIAIGGDVPMLLLTFLTALAGASTIVAGAMLLTGAVNTNEFESVSTTERLDDDWWWYVIYAVLAVAGIVAQLADRNRRVGSVRESWRDTGGREMRAYP
jgi:hypothetical protein